MSSIVTVDEAIKEISVSWRKTTQAIIETAKVLKKYQLESNWSEIQEKLDAENIIKVSVQKFLLGIGNNPVLMNEQNYEKLPPHYNTLYHLSTIKSEKLEKLINKSEVNVSTDLADARELAIKYGEKKKKLPSPKSPKVTFTITFNSPTGLKSKANRIYNELIGEFGDDAVHMKLDV
jgi:hypothetical protein